MSKGTIFVVVCSLLIIASFFMSCYLITTVDPPPLETKSKMLDENYEVISGEQNFRKAGENNPLESLIPFYRYAPAKIYLSSDESLTTDPYTVQRNVKPPCISPRSFSSSTVSDLAEDNGITEINSSSLQTFPVKGFRRSINSFENKGREESSGSVIIKILDNNGRPRIEIKLITDNSSASNNVTKIDSNLIMHVQKNNVKNNFFELGYKTEIKIFSNDTVHIDSNNKLVDREKSVKKSSKDKVKQTVKMSNTISFPVTKFKSEIYLNDTGLNTSAKRSQLVLGLKDNGKNTSGLENSSLKLVKEAVNISNTISKMLMPAVKNKTEASTDTRNIHVVTTDTKIQFELDNNNKVAPVSGNDSLQIVKNMANVSNEIITVLLDVKHTTKPSLNVGENLNKQSLWLTKPSAKSNVSTNLKKTSIEVTKTMVNVSNVVSANNKTEPNLNVINYNNNNILRNLNTVMIEKNKEIGPKDEGITMLDVNLKNTSPKQVMGLENMSNKLLATKVVSKVANNKTERTRNLTNHNNNVLRQKDKKIPDLENTSLEISKDIANNSDSARQVLFSAEKNNTKPRLNIRANILNNVTQKSISMIESNKREATTNLKNVPLKIIKNTVNVSDVNNQTLLPVIQNRTDNSRNDTKRLINTLTTKEKSKHIGSIDQDNKSYSRFNLKNTTVKVLRDMTNIVKKVPISVEINSTRPNLNIEINLNNLVAKERHIKLNNQSKMTPDFKNTTLETVNNTRSNSDVRETFFPLVKNITETNFDDIISLNMVSRGTNTKAENKNADKAATDDASMMKYEDVEILEETVQLTDFIKETRFAEVNTKDIYNDKEKNIKNRVPNIGKNKTTKQTVEHKVLSKNVTKPFKESYGVKDALERANILVGNKYS